MNFTDRLKHWFPWYALQNISIITIGNFVIYLTGFLYGVAGARILGPREFGQLVVIIAVVKFIAEPFDLEWAKPITKLVRESIENDQRTKTTRLTSAVIHFHLVFLVGFGVIFLLFLFFLPPYWNLFKNWQTSLGLYALSELSMRARRLMVPFFQATERFGLVSLYKSTAAMSRDLLPIGFMFWGIQATCLGYFLAEVFLVLITIGFVLYFRAGKFLDEFEYSVYRLTPHYRELFLNARSNYLAKLLKRWFGKFQSLLIGGLIGTAEVAFYQIGKKFNKIFLFAAKPLKTYLFPRFIEKWENDRDEFFYTLRKYIYQSFTIFTGLGILLYLVVPYFIPSVYGQEFVPSVTVTFILIPALVLNAIFYGYDILAFVVSRQRSLVDLSIARVSVGLPAFVVLTYYYSYFGAAWALALAYYGRVSLLVYFLVKEFNFRWLRES